MDNSIIKIESCRDCPYLDTLYSCYGQESKVCSYIDETIDHIKEIGMSCPKAGRELTVIFSHIINMELE